MDPKTQKIIIEILKICGKAAFTGITYVLVARVHTTTSKQIN